MLSQRAFTNIQTPQSSSKFDFCRICYGQDLSLHGGQNFQTW